MGREHFNHVARGDAVRLLPGGEAPSGWEAFRVCRQVELQPRIAVGTLKASYRRLGSGFRPTDAAPLFHKFLGRFFLKTAFLL